MVKPAINLKAQLSPSTSELFFLHPSKMLCPYGKVTRNVIVDMSKVKESFLEEYKGFVVDLSLFIWGYFVFCFFLSHWLQFQCQF